MNTALGLLARGMKLSHLQMMVAFAETGQISAAAQALGIGRNTITRKIAELGIDGGKEHAAE